MSEDIRKDIIGGQAVIEGVMMINKNDTAIAVRKPTGKIVLKKGKIPKFLDNHIIKFPLIRGFIKLFVMMFIGIKAINYSSEIALEEEEEEIKNWQVFLMIGISMIVAISLFKFLPLIIANALTKNNILFNIIDGIVKIGLFVSYVWAISFMKDVKRLYEYHGAEHATVHCYESGKKLTPQNVSKFTTLHPRCGTAFIMIVLLTSIVVYTFIPKDTTLLYKFVLRILLLPLIAGVSYELLRFSAKYQNNFLVKMMVAPGLWLQRITTQKPDKKQIEVAIKAMKAVI